MESVVRFDLLTLSLGPRRLAQKIFWCLMTQAHVETIQLIGCSPNFFFLFVFVLRFYGPVNPMGSCRGWSVYLTTRLLDRLSPLSS